MDLTQNALIEASAGTGKTFTITTLYLRAMLGLRVDGAEISPLTVDQILVVTFTDAATQELKGRIREKLVEAQSAMVAPDNASPIVGAVIKEFVNSNLARSDVETEEQALRIGYHLLQKGIELIDEAAIYTIHGFCHKILQRFALETNSSFEVNFEMDATNYHMQAVIDFWRKYVMPLQQIEFDYFASYWKTPEAFYSELQRVLFKPIQIVPNTTEKDYLAQIQQYQKLLGELKNHWKNSDFSSVLVNSGLKKNLNQFKKITILNEWLECTDLEPNFDSKVNWMLWNSESLHDPSKYSAKKTPIEHEIIDKIDEICVLQDRLLPAGFKSYWIEKAKTYVENRVKQNKVDSQVIFPDDLLLDVSNALNGNTHGELVNKLRADFPLAFIDEFQDTDPVQYDIFHSIYGNSSDANMVLIGDPKQAIYKFRGADIYTYIEAKKDIDTSNHYTLDTNWRSHPDLIRAVNQCFLLSDNVFQQTEIPFVEVSAGQVGQNQLLIDGKPTSVMSFTHLQPEVDQDDLPSDVANHHLATECANQIKQLLSLSQQGRAVIQRQKGMTPVTSADISILVRNRRQAKWLKQALAFQGIDSVFLSRDSLFGSELAKDLLRLFLAFDSPSNEKRLRAAVATSFFSYTDEELINLFSDSHSLDSKWNETVSVFHECHLLWRQGRVSAAINALIEYTNCIHRWLEQDLIHSERMVTDLRHLIEVVQEKAVELSGQQKIIKWLQNQIQQSENSASSSEQMQLRLESDEQLIQINTFHASKGLEYPIVYLPYLMDFSAAKEAIFHSTQTGLSLRSDNRKQELQIAEHERLLEDIRLLYVAMTRAELALNMFVYAPTEGRSKKACLHQTAIGQLIPSLVDYSSDNEALADFCSRIQGLTSQNREDVVSYQAYELSFISATSQTLAKQTLAIEQSQTLVLQNIKNQIRNDWQVLSYSSLAHQSSTHYDTDLNWYSGLSDEGGAQKVDNIDIEQLKTPFSFPKGANAGSCLHWILEQLDFTQPVIEQKTFVEQGLQKFNIDLAWVDITVDWISSILNTPISHFSLAHLTNQQKLVEMEFYFDFSRLDSKVLGNALLMAGFESAFVYGFEFESGVMKGFIDLTFEYDGRFYVADYKSNYLGSQLDDYLHRGMQEAMSDHNYYLQALIYTLALHRFLKMTIPSYQYNEHVGGAMYLFLRGMQSSKESYGVYHIEFKEDVILYLDNALRSGGAGLTLSKNDKNETTRSDNQQQIGFEF